MDQALAEFIKQKGKNLTLLIIAGTIISVVHDGAAVAVFSAVCLAVGAPAVAEKWPSSNPKEGS